MRPDAALAALTAGAALADIRPLEQRIVEGEVPGAIIIGRNVLEWRLDRRSDARIPALARTGGRIIVMCSEGFASTLAAASLRRIGLHRATYLDGGSRRGKPRARPPGLPSRRADGGHGPLPLAGRIVTWQRLGQPQSRAGPRHSWGNADQGGG